MQAAATYIHKKVKPLENQIGNNKNKGIPQITPRDFNLARHERFFDSFQLNFPNATTAPNNGFLLFRGQQQKPKETKITSTVCPIQNSFISKTEKIYHEISQCSYGDWTA